MAVKGRGMGRREIARGAAAQAAPAEGLTRQASVELWERIARKAYELWEQRGRPEGRDMENWLDAEAVVMDEAHEARE